MADSLSRRYQELLDGSYDCVDRIVLNAYFRQGHSAGGFRVWWRQLTGSDETLDTTHLMRMAGRFSRRVRGYAKAHGIPVIDCVVGERKHDLAEDHLAKTTITKGVFLILVGRAQAPIWEVSGKHHLERKHPLPYVNHYSFHIVDPHWGHVTIKVSGHPPCPAQILLNGHEYVACRARKAGIRFVKDGNCFTHVSDPAALAAIADTLSDPRTVGRLRQFCDHWIYSACLCFALDLEEQRRSGFRDQYSTYQIEYRRNLVFTVGAQMDRVFQALIDRSRVPLGLKTIKTILGYARRPRYRARRHTVPAWDVSVENPVYDLMIFKLHCGRLTLKIHTKGERVLRVEAMAHNTRDLDCGRVLDRLPRIVHELKDILERFVDSLSCVDQCFIGPDTLDQLAAPSRVGTVAVAGVDLSKPRMRWVAQAVVALALSPRGFSAADVAQHVRQLAGARAPRYASRQAAYDLKKLRGHHLVRRVARTRRYEPVPNALKTLAAAVVLRDKVIHPLLAAAEDGLPSRGAQNPTPLDHHSETLRLGMRTLFQDLGLAA